MKNLRTMAFRGLGKQKIIGRWLSEASERKKASDDGISEASEMKKHFAKAFLKTWEMKKHFAEAENG